MANLKETQEAMVKVWGSSACFLKYKSGELNSLENEIVGSLDPRRMKLYFDDVDTRRWNLLCECFRLTLRVLGKKRSSVIERYWDQHTSSSFNPVLEFGSFPSFLRENLPGTFENDEMFPYLSDLAEYEWLRKSVMLNSMAIKRGKNKNLQSRKIRMCQQPMLNPTLHLKRFDYPVHQIASRVARSRWRKYSYERSDYYVVAYQDPADPAELRVLELGDLPFYLLHASSQKASSYEDLIQRLLELMPEQSSDAAREEAIEELIDMILQFEQCGIIIGSQPVA